MGGGPLGMAAPEAAAAATTRPSTTATAAAVAWRGPVLPVRRPLPLPGASASTPIATAVARPAMHTSSGAYVWKQWRNKAGAVDGYVHCILQLRCFKTMYSWQNPVWCCNELCLQRPSLHSLNAVRPGKRSFIKCRRPGNCAPALDSSVASICPAAGKRSFQVAREGITPQQPFGGGNWPMPQLQQPRCAAHTL